MKIQFLTGIELILLRLCHSRNGTILCQRSGTCKVGEKQQTNRDDLFERRKRVNCHDRENVGVALVIADRSEPSPDLGSLDFA